METLLLETSGKIRTAIQMLDEAERYDRLGGNRRKSQNLRLKAMNMLSESFGCIYTLASQMRDKPIKHSKGSANK